MDEDIIMKFALEKPAFRILVNTQAALGAVGFTNELLPSMTLGPGTFGGSIISENVSAKHMINVKRLAFETRPINQPEGDAEKTKSQMPSPRSEIQPTVSHNAPQSVPKTSPTKSWMEEIDERIRLKATNAPIQKRVESSSTPPKSSGSLGTGISDEDVEKIIREFTKR